MLAGASSVGQRGGVTMSSTGLILLIVPIVALVLTVAIVAYSTLETSKIVSDAERRQSETLTKQVGLLIEKISIRVNLCSSPEEVAREAASLVDQARAFS